MLKQLRQWRERRQAAQRTADFNRGFDYAAGALLRGEETPQSLEAKVWEVESFDRGMFAATDKLVQAGLIQDNRL